MFFYVFFLARNKRSINVSISINEQVYFTCVYACTTLISSEATIREDSVFLLPEFVSLVNTNLTSFEKFV